MTGPHSQNPTGAAAPSAPPQDRSLNMELFVHEFLCARDTFGLPFWESAYTNHFPLEVMANDMREFGGFAGMRERTAAFIAIGVPFMYELGRHMCGGWFNQNYNADDPRCYVPKGPPSGDETLGKAYRAAMVFRFHEQNFIRLAQFPIIDFTDRAVTTLSTIERDQLRVAKERFENLSIDGTSWTLRHRLVFNEVNYADGTKIEGYAGNAFGRALEYDAVRASSIVAAQRSRLRNVLGGK